jgi:hypothetical protein
MPAFTVVCLLFAMSLMPAFPAFGFLPSVFPALCLKRWNSGFFLNYPLVYQLSACFSAYVLAWMYGFMLSCLPFCSLLAYMITCLSAHPVRSVC